ncbi:MAG: hypothetical protein ABI574_05260, partial [Burkholderiales bacterium]
MVSNILKLVIAAVNGLASHGHGSKPGSRKPQAGATTPWLTHALAGALLVCAQGAVAQPAVAPYPSGPLHIIVPFAPGGATDQIVRLIALRLQQALAQPVVVDNHPGADGILGA